MKQDATKIEIHRTANGWGVKATLVYDAGDQLPWPYVHEFSFESTQKMLAQLGEWLAWATPERLTSTAVSVRPGA